jgi:enamine deaminase RidA (YjgF/YER057c/UK114 family)
MSVLRYEDLIKLNIYLRDVHTTDVLEQVAAELAPASNPAVALHGVESRATRLFRRYHFSSDNGRTA